MFRLYKTLLTPLVIYLLTSNAAIAGDPNIVSYNSKLLSNGNISLTATLENKKGNHGCFYLDYVQVLRNFNSPIGTDTDGTPILSRWITTWKNKYINNSGSGPAPYFNFSKAKKTCSNLNSTSSLDNKIQAKSKDKSWSMTLNQGSVYFSNNRFNQSTKFEDADLRIGVVYLPKASSSNYITGVSYLSLASMIEVNDNKLSHNLKYPGYIKSRRVPLAYSASGKNLGCLGNFNQKKPLKLSNYNCYFASQASQKAGHTPFVVSRERRETDVLIMCPGSEIANEVNLMKHLRAGGQLTKENSSPYLQVMVKDTPSWCQQVEKIERKWVNLQAVTSEGWIVSHNPLTNKLECIGAYGYCLNSLYKDINLEEINESPEKLAWTNSIPLTHYTTRRCQYKNGSIALCPTPFSEKRKVNILIESLEFNSIQLSANEL